MKVLGIEIKGSTIIGIACLDQSIISFPNKIELKDSYDSEEIRNLHEELKSLFSQLALDHIIIKKRMEKGKFAGGAASFKLEGIIQLASNCPVDFIAGTKLSAFQKKANHDLSGVKKYQEQAYLAALTLLD
ncbi:MAG: DUF3010 family protein [Lentisphaeraceae bacterium]|nr:DUF3010 family protein [Lentisphaeraceae bacterium]